MSTLSEDDRIALESLRRAVAEALERKRCLGQYAVVWRDGRPACIGPDAPSEQQPYGQDSSGPWQGVAEPQGQDD